ncbi:MAG: pyridoxal phosphate-dependent aminotransferase [Candidatus Promineifilaceae bacterium]
MNFAERTAELRPEGAYQVLARAGELEAQGRSIIHLEIGQPDFNTPDNISLSGIRAIATGHTRYNPTAGLAELREVIAADAGYRRGMEIRPQQVLVSPGAKPNLFFPTLALVEPGDEVIYPNPGFPSYEAMITVAGGVPVPVPLLEENDFSFDLAAFERLLSERTKLIVLNSPSNPTGGVMPLEHLRHIAKIARERDIWVISDEIYTRLVFDGRQAPSIAALPGMAERTIIMDGFSKTYAMTGWRLGYGIMPEALARRVQLLFTHALGSTAHFTQIAGVEALTGTQAPVEAMLARYQQRRDIIVEGLNALPGITCRKPQGAFYVFPNVRALGLPADELANLFLEEAGVALLPGTSFGSYGEGYLRLSYANSIANIERALERMEKVARQVAGGK